MTTGITAPALIIKYFGAGNMPAAMYVLASVDQNEGGVPGKPGEGYSKQHTGTRDEPGWDARFKENLRIGLTRVLSL